MKWFNLIGMGIQAAVGIIRNISKYVKKGPSDQEILADLEQTKQHIEEKEKEENEELGKIE